VKLAHVPQLNQDHRRRLAATISGRAAAKNNNSSGARNLAHLITVTPPAPTWISRRLRRPSMERRAFIIDPQAGHRSHASPLPFWSVCLADRLVVGIALAVAAI
jgi:hypothetical protein